MRFLIVDDVFVNRQLLVNLLRPWGECDSAMDGREAVEAFTLALQEERPYDLICMDIMMPNMDGMQALEKIRHIEREYGIQGLAGVKVLMTTASDTREHIFGTFRTGCEGYLVKPVTKQKLYEELVELGLIPAEVGKEG